MRIPRTNNVYGQVIAPDGLRAAVVALEAALGPGTVSTYRSRRGADAETLRIRTDAADFESLPLPGGMEHLLNGAVAGSPDDVARFVRKLSAALAEAKVEHTFDVHDGRRIILSVP